MSVKEIFIQNLVDCRDVALVGGKAANLGRLLRGGFRVPGGFVVTTAAYCARRNDSAEIAGMSGECALPPEIAEEVRAAYEAMGAGPVAVRSSATAEDLASASMAGQYETFLNIEGEVEVVRAIGACWASVNAPRLQAYFRQHGIEASGAALAVVVQRLVPADVAGVLFTVNPQNGRRSEMLIEASWGLGESVVSGRVQPDVICLASADGRVLSATIADKEIYLPARGAASAENGEEAGGGEQKVDEARRRRSCLSSRAVHRLWELGKRAADYFGAPQDIEWAIQGDDVFLLQSRPITTLQNTETQERILETTRERLRTEAASSRGPWALHNLAETLAHPTPLTWSVIQRFMSGNGGFGEMYRQAGFEPAPAVAEAGFLERIAGRIYMDAARAPEMFFADFPYAYDAEELKRSPDASQAAPTLPRGSVRARGAAGRRLQAANARLRAISVDLDKTLSDKLFAEITQYVNEARRTNLSALTTEQLSAFFEENEKQVLQVYAPQLLMPTLISGMAMEELQRFLAEYFWNEDAVALAQLISSGGPANRTLLADAELYEVGKSRRTLDDWLTAHGHRAAGEFDLAAARWRECPDAAREMAQRLAGGDDPLARHRAHQEAVEARIAALREQIGTRERAEMDRRIDLVRRYIIFREDGKDFLMLGYDLLRSAALEAGRRMEIGADVFYLSRDKMFEVLRAGFVPYELIAQRKTEYAAEEKIALPRFMDAAAVEQLGAPAAPVNHADGYAAFPVSAGQAAGAARILRTPTDVGDLGRGYILVCPSTDPSWTPLFINAAGLVLERGGALSHGAVVAREMGLPAVVLPEATRLFAEGEMISVDGSGGWISRGAQAANAPASATVDADDTRIAHELIPPPPGCKDRQAAKIRNIAALLWTIFLLAFFLLPESYVRQPTLTVIDTLLWPLVRGVGRPATVALVAILTALATLLVQKFMTDNERLCEAKRRAAQLMDAADQLPAKSRRRAALLGHGAGVPRRTLLAALVPVGILLGPLCMPFVWFQERMEPVTWNAPAGSAVRIVATVDADFPGAVRLDVPSSVEIDAASPAARTLPPIRATLEHLLALYRQPVNHDSDPWEVTVGPDVSRQKTADELQAYLQEGLPAQSITWVLRPADDFAGRFDVTVTAADHAPVHAKVTLGDRNPPSPRSVAGPAGSPVRQVRVVYPTATVAVAFWRPFAALGHTGAAGLAARLARWDIGWLWVYLIAYVPVLLIARMLLRVA